VPGPLLAATHVAAGAIVALMGRTALRHHTAPWHVPAGAWVAFGCLLMRTSIASGARTRTAAARKRLVAIQSVGFAVAFVCLLPAKVPTGVLIAVVDQVLPVLRATVLVVLIRARC
jgi:hypothetical protein